MIRGVNVDITIRDNKTGKYLRIPVLPEVISFQGGDAMATSVAILQLGNVEYPNGVDLDAVSWSAFFPARYDPAYCSYSNLKTPTEYATILSSWKAAGTSLQLIIPAAGINKTMYVKSFAWDFQGFEGDAYYQLTFRELKSLRPIQIAVNTAAIRKKANKTPAARPAVPEKPAAKTYTVVSGDYLIKIAKKVGVSDWHTIYNANKDKIKNPNLIYPGQVLTIP